MQAQQQRAAAVQDESVEDENLGPQLVSRLEVKL